MTTKTVVATRGIPASGKTTWVGDKMSALGLGQSARINNDDLATMLHLDPWKIISHESSTVLASLRAKILQTLLDSMWYETIFIDNTNLSVRSLHELESITARHGATFVVNDEFLRVPFDEALRRNEARERPVPYDVMLSMQKKATALKPWKPMIVPDIKPYHNDIGLPGAVLVDIDGTLAHRYPSRGVHQYDKVHLDIPDRSLVRLVSLLSISDRVIVISGRTEDCREQTRLWLDTHVQPGLELLMRGSGDYRPDWVVKHELFKEHIENRYHVRFVLDDRDQVVDLWRNRLGLPTYQVAKGDF